MSLENIWWLKLATCEFLHNDSIPIFQRTMTAPKPNVVVYEADKGGKDQTQIALSLWLG